MKFYCITTLFPVFLVNVRVIVNYIFSRLCPQDISGAEERCEAGARGAPEKGGEDGGGFAQIPGRGAPSRGGGGAKGQGRGECGPCQVH